MCAESFLFLWLWWRWCTTRDCCLASATVPVCWIETLNPRRATLWMTVTVKHVPCVYVCVRVFDCVHTALLKRQTARSPSLIRNWKSVCLLQPRQTARKPGYILHSSRSGWGSALHHWRNHSEIPFNSSHIKLLNQCWLALSVKVSIAILCLCALCQAWTNLLPCLCPHRALTLPLSTLTLCPLLCWWAVRLPVVWTAYSGPLSQ